MSGATSVSCFFFFSGQTFITCLLCAQLPRNGCVFDLTCLFFTSLRHLATVPRTLGLILVAWKDNYHRRPPSTKASLPTCPPSIRCYLGPKRKAALTMMHHRLRPLPSPPWLLTHGQGWQLGLISWWGGTIKVDKTLHHGVARLNTATAAARLSPRCRGSARVPDHTTVFIYMSCSNYAPVQVLTSFIHLLV